MVGHRQSSHFQGDTGVLNNSYKMLQVQWSQVYVSRYLPTVTICWLSSNTLPVLPRRSAPCFQQRLTGFRSADTSFRSSNGAGDLGQAHQPI